MQREMSSILFSVALWLKMRPTLMEKKTSRQVDDILCMFTMVQQDLPNQSRCPLLQAEGPGYTPFKWSKGHPQT